MTGQSNPSGYTLTSAIGATDTSITLSSTVNLAAAGFIQIDNEIILYGSITGNTLNSCFRGQYNTVAAPHLAGAAVTVQNLPAITVWPTPDQGTTTNPYYQFVYWRMRRIQDAGNGVNVEDIPFRFIPPMVAGLAYYLSMKIQGVDPNRIAALKADYEQQFDLAAQEDREKAPIRFIPRQTFLGIK
jgi:hypothetical protein